MTTETRKAVLEEVTGIICKDRNTTHGEPENVFETIAELWEAYLRGRGIIEDESSSPGVLPHDVATMMVLFKAARCAGNPQHYDNYVDMVGYAAIAAELAGTR